MAIVSLEPTRTYPILSTITYETITVVAPVLTTGGGVRTLTTDEIMSGLLTVDCQDAQTMTTPTAALLVAAIPSCQIGVSFEFTVINYGDTTLTVGLGTGVTKTTIATVASVMTLLTLTSKRFRMVCTGVQKLGSTADAWVIYTVSASSAVVA